MSERSEVILGHSEPIRLRIGGMSAPHGVGC
jgi:hypothetical protein